MTRNNIGRVRIETVEDMQNQIISMVNLQAIGKYNHLAEFLVNISKSGYLMSLAKWMRTHFNDIFVGSGLWTWKEVAAFSKEWRSYE